MNEALRWAGDGRRRATLTLKHVSSYAARLADVKTSMLQDFERGRSTGTGADRRRGHRTRRTHTALTCRIVRDEATRPCAPGAAGVTSWTTSRGPLRIVVGRAKAEDAVLFRELGIDTARDLLEYFRFDMKTCDSRRLPPVWGMHRVKRTPSGASSPSKSGGFATLKSSSSHARRRRRHVRCKVDRANAVSFTDAFAKECGLFVRGRAERTFAGPVVNVAQYAVLGEGEEYRGEMVPVYRASKDLATRKIAAVVKKNLPRLLTRAPRRRCVAARRCRERAVTRRCAKPIGRRTHRERRKRRGAPASDLYSREFLALATAAQLRRAQRERDRDAQALRVPPALLEEFERRSAVHD